MHVAHLSLTDFRSYSQVDLDLGVGVTTFVGPNGQGKTNLVEAVDYAASLRSHRVATDAPLVRFGAERAIVRVAVGRDNRTTLIELEIVPGRANRARVNRAPVPRPREVLGILRTVLFAPEDLALVKGDPGERRRFLDELLVARSPRMAAVRADYERVLKQRNALLKSVGPSARATRGQVDLSTLEVWDTHLAAAGAALVHARLGLVESLRPLVTAAYGELARSAGQARLDYRSSMAYPGSPPPAAPAASDLVDALLRALRASRRDELDRGLTLVGPHRDDLVLGLGELLAKGFASHGESWSFALALKLAAYRLLAQDGSADGEPVLLLDDVFAELDSQRRDRLAGLVAGAGQVLVTAAVAMDVPAALRGSRVDVSSSGVSRVA